MKVDLFRYDPAQEVGFGLRGGVVGERRVVHGGEPRAQPRAQSCEPRRARMEHVLIQL